MQTDAVGLDSSSELGNRGGGLLGKTGLEVQNLDDSLAGQLGLDSTDGVVITQVLPGSAAADVGLKAGMVIREVNQIPIHNRAELTSAMKEGTKQLLLLLEHQGNRRFVVLDIEGSK